MKEPDLIKGCQRARHDAQQELYRVYANRMYRLCFRYIKLQADAEDVMISSFNKVFQHFSSFHYEGEGSLEACNPIWVWSEVREIRPYDWVHTYASSVLNS